MKPIALATLFLLAAAAAAAPVPSQLCTLRIEATGFRNQKGIAGASIFASANGWPEHNDKAFTQDAVPIAGRQATLTFQLPPGRYGVVVLHDENLNHKLDRNFLGIPVEGFGFANNPHVFLTAPSFKAASVNVKCPETDIHILMNYK